METLRTRRPRCPARHADVGKRHRKVEGARGRSLKMDWDTEIQRGRERRRERQRQREIGTQRRKFGEIET